MFYEEPKPFTLEEDVPEEGEESDETPAEEGAKEGEAEEEEI